MPSPVVAPQSAQFHPEFGYFWPAPRYRRLLRAVAVCAVCGVVAGALVLSAEFSPAGFQSIPASTARTVAACAEQTWPYLARQCLSEPSGVEARNVRVVRPDQPARSAPAIVIAAPTGREMVKAQTQADEAKAAAKAKKIARAEKRVHHVRRRVVNPEVDEGYQAYATPYRGRYEPRGRDWGWGW